MLATTHRKFVLAYAVLALVSQLIVSSAVAQDPLPSWNDGAAKSEIINFVTAVTTRDGPDYVTPAERIATFDNDGTLWGEQPVYVQLAFALDRIKAMAPDRPEWQHTEPFKSVINGDLKGLVATG
ncbi:MAG: haloacid dehalogenase-like hydrolase, partial [Hyphomicrobiaceae bacterium]